MARWATHRVDNTAKALVKYAEDLGFVVHQEGGTIDAYLCLGTKIAAVEWKSPGGTLTPKQQRLIARGFHVVFVSRPEQLDALRSELMK